MTNGWVDHAHDADILFLTGKSRSELLATETDHDHHKRLN